jgi:hypothetical protein
MIVSVDAGKVTGFITHPDFPKMDFTVSEGPTITNELRELVSLTTDLPANSIFVKFLPIKGE